MKYILISILINRGGYLYLNSRNARVTVNPCEINLKTLDIWVLPTTFVYMGSSGLPKIAIVEDSYFISKYLEKIFSTSGFEVLFISQDYQSTLQNPKLSELQSILIDIDLGRGPNGIDLAEYILLTFPKMCVIFLSSYTNIDLLDIKATIKSRAIFLSKDLLRDEKKFKDLIRISFSNGISIPDLADSYLSGLTKRYLNLNRTDYEYLFYIYEGHSNRSIAKKRSVSVKGVEKAIAKTAKKLGVSEDPDQNMRIRLAKIFLDIKGNEAS